ncbi:hypothetical protein [Comamonas testosteroni]|uniref:hypothetical protein n=1 Tax=Comamonas testosteroni TaxID=285 RepID=UPI0005B5412F|nr:hypothetical protein [Comamonas testosteroni]
MALMRFSNNAEATTATLLRDSPDWDGFPFDEDLANQYYLGFEIGAADDPELFHFFSPETPDGGVQPLTLTHSSMPGVYEIVYLSNRAGRSFTVQRAKEGTQELEWPIGTKVSANVTAGLLRSLLQDDGSVAKANYNGAVLIGAGISASTQNAPIGRDSFLFGSRARAERLVQFAAYPALHAHMAARVEDRGRYSNDQDLGLGHEATGASVHVDIGVPPQWSSATSYGQGRVVVPTTPNGYQYWLDLNLESVGSGFNTESEPAFTADGYATALYVGEPSWENFVGNWVPIPMPVRALSYFRFPLLVTEVGFIGRVNGTLTQTPTVSIGTESNPTLLANGVALDQLAPEGELSAHRILIPGGGQLLSEMLFTVNQAGVGASVKGRFYWRGIFYSEE